MEARSLLKLYGIRFDILVTGRVGRQGWWGQGVTVTPLGGYAGRVGRELGGRDGHGSGLTPSLRQGNSGSSPRLSLWAQEQPGWAW